MSQFSKFLNKYAGEIKAIGSLAMTLARGVGLDPQERRAVEQAAEGLANAADSIEKSLKDVKALTEIKISKADLKKAVEDMLPDIVADLVAAGVKKALAELPAPTAVEGQEGG